jgi:hypothetical protein
VTARASDDTMTLAAIGVAAATLAAVAHEAVGHAGACLATNGRVLLLSSIFFRCEPGRDLVDVAGPFMGLACGAAALAWRPRARSAHGRLFLLLLIVFNLFWFFGQLARDGLMRMDDWAFATPTTAASLALGAVGVAGYIWTMRAVRGLAPADGATLRRLLIPYLAGAISAGVAGVLWREDSLDGAREGLLTLGVAALGYIWSVRRADLRPEGSSVAVGRDWRWIGGSAVVFAIFCLTQGLGLGG